MRQSLRQSLIKLNEYQVRLLTFLANRKEEHVFSYVFAGDAKLDSPEDKKTRDIEFYLQHWLVEKGLCEDVSKRKSKLAQQVRDSLKGRLVRFIQPTEQTRIMFRKPAGKEWVN